VIAEVISPVSTTETKGRGARKLADLRMHALVQAGVMRPAARTDRPWAKGRLVKAPAGTARRLLDADRAE